MNMKYIGILIGVLLISIGILSSCAQDRGTGYSTYNNNVPPPRVSGGGCGVGAPADNGNDISIAIAQNMAEDNIL